MGGGVIGGSRGSFCGGAGVDVDVGVVNERVCFCLLALPYGRAAQKQTGFVYCCLLRMAMRRTDTGCGEGGGNALI